MYWLLLLPALALFALACLTSDSAVLSIALLLSLFSTLAWARSLGLRQAQRPLQTWLDADALQRLGQRLPGQEA